MNQRVTRLVQLETALAVAAGRRRATATLKSGTAPAPRWEASSPLGFAIFREEISRNRD